MFPTDYQRLPRGAEDRQWAIHKSEQSGCSRGPPTRPWPPIGKLPLGYGQRLCSASNLICYPYAFDMLPICYPYATPYLPRQSLPRGLESEVSPKNTEIIVIICHHTQQIHSRDLRQLLTKQQHLYTSLQNHFLQGFSRFKKATL